MQQYLLDGVAYNVSVTKLSRKFSIMDAEGSGRTQNGEMYRDVVGTFYNYSMTVEPRDNKQGLPVGRPCDFILWN